MKTTAPTGGPLGGALDGLPRPTLIEWLCLPLGVALLLRYAWLMDDCFIYFRYVDNLWFGGHGLVFNEGEYVDGLSSPLWVLILAALRWTHVTWWILIRLVGVVCFVPFWYLLVASNRLFAGKGSPTVNFPLCYLSLHYATLSYFTSGMDGPVFALLAACYGVFVLRPSSGTLQVVLGLSPLLRHELLVPLVIAGAWGWWKERAIPWKLVASFVLFVGGWGLFRIYYYAELLPITFYIKDTVDLAQGFFYLHDGFRPYGFYVIAPVSLALAFMLWRRCGKAAHTLFRERLVLWAMAGSMLVYLVKIGGDWIHFRYVAFPFTLILIATGGLIEQWVALVGKPRLARWSPVAGLVTAAWVVTLYPPQVTDHPVFGKGTSGGYHQIKDAHRPRMMRGLAFWSAGKEIEADYSASSGGTQHVEVAWVCQGIYQAPGSHAIHSLGLTDPILARVKMKADAPGHRWGLVALAEDLARIKETTPGVPGRGMHRAAIDRGDAPPWVVNNIDELEVLERKLYNTHDFFENLGLALRFPHIDPVDDERQGRILDIAATYRDYGRVDDVLRGGLGTGRPGTGENDHYGLLYHLYASAPEAYLDPARGPAPVGQTLVKETWLPVLLADGAELAGPSVVDRLGKRFGQGEPHELFIMHKLDPRTPGTDEGWIYARVSRDGRELLPARVGLSGSCHVCHANGNKPRQPNDRQYGFPDETPPSASR